MVEDNIQKYVISLLSNFEKKSNISFKNFQKEKDLFIINKNKPNNALICANPFGDEIYSSYTLLSYLGINVNPDYNIHALPFLHIKNNPFKDEITDKIIDYIIQNQIKLYVSLTQAAKKFDGFYIQKPYNMKTDRSKEITLLLRQKGYDVGKYSLETDMPTYSIVNSTDKFLTQISKIVEEAYIFKVQPDDVSSGIISLAYILGDETVYTYPKQVLTKTSISETRI